MIHSLTVLGFDPGVKMGWAKLIYYPQEDRIEVHKTDTIDGNKLLKTRREMGVVFSKEFCRLDAVYEQLCLILGEVMPDFVVSEAAFAGRFISAALSLNLVIHTLRRASQAILNKDLRMVAPKESKKTVAFDHEAKKDKMKAAVLAYKNLSFHLVHKDHLNLTEHEYDAIAHAITFIKIVLPLYTVPT